MSFDPKDKEELFPEIESDANDDEEDRPEHEAETEEVVERASKAARKLEPIVLAHVLGAKYQPVKPRVIAKQLKLPSEQHKALKLAIRRLAKSGKLLYGAGHLVRAPKGKHAAGEIRDKSNTLTPAFSQGERESRSERPASSKQGKNVVIGKFRRTSKGFGFV